MPEEPHRTGIEQEVRFAVVMYGGVSLAVYMHGVTQELWHLVRATAPAVTPEPASAAEVPDGLRFADAELTPAQRVYRELGRRLGRDGLAPAGDPGGPVRTRFVVDVASGTSAGGLNAVYLAKALARGHDLRGMQELWLQEADLERLLNDAASADGGLRPQRPPRSVLNGQRMYLKLLEALDAMEDEVDRGAGAPPVAAVGHASPARGLVDEVDLFVTGTDLQGLRVPIRLADRVVDELRHRHVFHFRYDARPGGVPADDFAPDRHPFLAYAARVTSAFPVAFEPMRLSDAAPLADLRRGSGRDGVRVADEGRWRRFFPGYPAGFARRAFADGGYLDNKPFGPAIDALRRRSADVPVDRKLLYVEPNPALLGDDAPRDPPNAIANALAAFALARHETIHEDLERLAEHNRRVDRVRTLLRGLDEDVARNEAFVAPEIRGIGSASDALFLDDTIGRPGFGVAYGSYHRLRVAAVTDELADAVAAALGAPDDGDVGLAVRYLVQAWRDRRYRRYRAQAADGAASEHHFLLRYDLAYRVRRLKYVLFRLDEAWLRAGAAVDPVARGDARAALGALRTRLVAPLQGLRRAQAALRDLGRREAFATHRARLVAEFGLDEAGLRALLMAGDEAARRATARRLLDDGGDAFEVALGWIAEEVVAPATRAAAAACEAVLREAEAAVAPTEPSARAVRAVAGVYRDFERHDLVLFPGLEGIDVGEELSHVDVLRIAPEDATAIVPRHAARTKLAGTALHSFGAFFDRGWRRNDVLWGRLDGAERLVAALVPPGRERADLVGRLHDAILAEELDLEGDGLAEAVAERLGRRAPERLELERIAAGDAVAGTVASCADADGTAAAPPAAGSGPRAQRLARVRAALRSGAGAPRPLDPDATMRLAGRGARVVGRMLEDLAGATAAGRGAGRALATIGTVAWGFVEVTVPGSLANLLGRHLLKVLLAFGAFALAGGLLLGLDQVRWFGAGVLGVTAGLWLVARVVRFARRRSRRRPQDAAP